MDFVTAKQFKNQVYPVGLSMIDLFTKSAIVIPIKEKTGEEVMPAIFKAFALWDDNQKLFTPTTRGHCQISG